ncbi:hypothetical protein LMG19083_04693 [Ralstonia psammae]|uniref:DUF1499 domain-containing protein n=1 Tax=Ralstonia psammae TaxID=3058598 RepID=A0ABN9JDS8_9RALS|nr:hypothetical protein LMG19083_04693 [Ralstonia sp. LMG 19083]
MRRKVGRSFVRDTGSCSGKRESCKRRQVDALLRLQVAGSLAMTASMSWASGGEAFTQFAETLERVFHVLQTAGVVVVALAISWAGYRILFQHARWADVATLVIGALFVGAAPSLAVWLLYGTSDGRSVAAAPAVPATPYIARMLERGDIVRFDRGLREASDAAEAARISLVISSATVNRRGRVLLVPIVSAPTDSPGQPLTVRIADGSAPTLALVDEMRTEAWLSREPQIVGRVSARSLAAVTTCVRAVAIGAHACGAAD